MPPHLSDADIERIALGVVDRTLPKPEWTHAAHFAAALWVLRRPDMDAARDMPGVCAVFGSRLLPGITRTPPSRQGSS